MATELETSRIRKGFAAAILQPYNYNFLYVKIIYSITHQTMQAFYHRKPVGLSCARISLLREKVNEVYFPTRVENTQVIFLN